MNIRFILLCIMHTPRRRIRFEMFPTLAVSYFLFPGTPTLNVLGFLDTVLKGPFLPRFFKSFTLHSSSHSRPRLWLCGAEVLLGVQAYESCFRLPDVRLYTQQTETCRVLQSTGRHDIIHTAITQSCIY